MPSVKESTKRKTKGYERTVERAQWSHVAVMSGGERHAAAREEKRSGKSFTAANKRRRRSPSRSWANRMGGRGREPHGGVI